MYNQRDSRRGSDHATMHTYPAYLVRMLRSLMITFLPFIVVMMGEEAGRAQDKRYQNPLSVLTAEGMMVESCADPSVIHSSRSGDGAWYMVCTTDPLSGADRDVSGRLIFHLIPIFKSLDLIHWSYVGDAFATRPDWVAGDAGLWAPDIQFFKDTYYLYYTVEKTRLPGGGSAIGVATSQSPSGPWTDSGTPVVEPHAAPCCPDEQRWTFDPAIITDDDGRRYLYYGSYFGGISARQLSTDGLRSDPNTQVQITIPNRYEAAFVQKHGGYYYLFVSATDCCRGPLTGYSVFAGRARHPLGPFVDRTGISLLAARGGGTLVLSMNGNRWVGPGHSALVTDLAGQDWLFYHAIDRDDPYFAGEVGFTKRPVLMDGLDWIDGWPTVRAGRWVSDTAQRAPVVQAGDPPRTTANPLPLDKPGKLISALSDEFDSTALRPQWHWVRQPAAGVYGLENKTLRFATQDADLHEGSNNASVLAEPAPHNDFLAETRVKLNLPATGCCHNFVQAGLVIYGGDDNYIKLTHVSIWDTRQTEFAKELYPVPAGYPRYGNTVVGSPAEWTYLRIVRRTCGREECYSAYTSRDGDSWVRGGTWSHRLGTEAQIGLVSMGGAGFTANFDYVQVYRLESASVEN